jgi:DNA-binding response OmpR family regulator
LRSVIVIDDDEDIVSVISELLELNGMKVIGKGHNGLEGAELFERLSPDLVLLDMMMPQYDGLYALKKIREKDASANVIIITGGYPDSIEDELQSLNPTKILFKPFDVNALTALFPVNAHVQSTFKIKYRFKDDDKYYTCNLSDEQYENFRKLSILQECEILTKHEKNVEGYASEMQKALNLAARNDTSHIRKLSSNV